MKTVRWTNPAKLDFLKICDWIDQASPAAAERIGARLLQSVSRLADRPKLGRPGRLSGTRELVVPGIPYIVIYSESDHLNGTILVLRVVHTAMQWPPEE